MGKYEELLAKAKGLPIPVRRMDDAYGPPTGGQEITDVNTGQKTTAPTRGGGGFGGGRGGGRGGGGAPGGPGGGAPGSAPAGGATAPGTPQP